MMTLLFWVIVGRYRRFEETLRPSFSPEDRGSMFLRNADVYESTWRHNLKAHRHIHRRQNHESHPVVSAKERLMTAGPSGRVGLDRLVPDIVGSNSA
jgi:hypothetical protein